MPEIIILTCKSLSVNAVCNSTANDLWNYLDIVSRLVFK